ncbi:MAG: ArsC family reductase [Gammaproteobacteria bacterium]|nr:ArsC family reductase [Gammaproteobacteria bacterium]MDH3449430.1 ArsC family reductase [Gammaproteobacteria bacterium]
MTRVTLYGIANCDTIKKARNWLDRHHVEFHFHDYREQGLDPSLLQSMESALGWEAMLNRRGTTWRRLPESLRQEMNRATALDVMLENPAIIRRPILSRNDQLIIGFNEHRYQEIFS